MSDQIGTASIGLAVDSSGVDAGLNRMEANVERTGRTLSSLGQRGRAAVENIGTGATTAANNVDRATRSIQNELQRVTAAAAAGERGTRAFYESLANQRGANLNALRPYLDQLEQVRAAQAAAQSAALRSGQAFNTQAQSAAQLSANLRGVPAQLTDIVTSIQGGQAPLTVFLQQGGQLRDMFGSAGAAARALGGYLASLVSPLTVAAGAVALLAVAYNQGSKEADAFRKSIILTGNAAGTTTSQLASMAKQASEVAGTQGANAEALAQLVGTGKVAADQLLRASITAVQSQKLLGIAVEDTVKAFAELGKDPLQATLKLNEQYNYLTLATYKQIKALTDQARTSDAAKVAQTAYADAMASKNKQVSESLGTLEKGWNATGAAAKSAWDYMLNVGRETTIDDKIKAAQEALKRADFARYNFTGGTQAEKQAAKEEAQRQLDSLQNQKKVAEIKAQYEAEDAKSRDAAIEFDKQGEQYLTRKLKMEKEIAAARSLGQQAAARGEDRAETEKRVQDRIAQIRQSYAALENEGIEKRIADIQRLGAIQEEQARRDLLIIQGRDEAGLNKAQDQKEAFIKATADADVAALEREKARTQQRLALVAQESVSIDGQAAQQEKLAALRGQIAEKDQQILTRRAQQEKDLFVLDVQNTQQSIESYNQLFDARRADLEAIDQQLQSQKDQNAALGLNADQLAKLNTQLVEERANRLEGKAAILDTILGREEEAEVLRKTAQRMRDLNQAQIEGARKVANLDAYKTFWASIDNAAQEAFSHIGEGGKSVFDRLRDSLKSGLLDLLYQLTVKQFIINVKANVSSDGFGALAGALSGSGGSGGGSSVLGTASNLFTIGKTIYSGFSAGIASSLGTQITSLGSLFGSEAISAFGTGLSLTTSQAATAAAAYGGTGTAVGGGLTAGAGAASAIPIIGWIIAGMMANDGFFKQGYRIDGQRGDITKELLASTLKGNFLGPIGATATIGIGAGDSLLRKLGLDDRTASLISGSSLWAKAFGRQSPTLESQGLQGTINAQGVTASNIATILEKGGWFRSDKRTNVSNPISTEADESFDKSIQAIVGSVKGFGKALGVESSLIDTYTKDFKLALTGDAEKDKAIVTGLFTDVGNELSTILVPSIAKLAKEGESASSALERVAQDYVAINGALGAIGLEFKTVGVSSLEMRESLITLSGGLDNFVAQAEFFSQNFLSESERVSAVTKQLNAAFADLGVTAIPKTRDEFKALVQGLDVSTEAGQKMFAGLMNLEQAFAQVTPQIDKAAQLQQQRQLDIQLMEALGDAEGALAATRADALKALLTDQARITQAQIYAAQDAKKIYDALVSAGDATLAGLTNSINAEKELINKAYTEQAEAIKAATQAALDNAQKSLQAAQTQVAALNTVFSALDSALSSTKIESDAANIGRRQAAQGVLAANLADPSKLADNKALTEAIGTITSQGNTRLFGTFEEYARDQARTNNTLVALRDAAGTQVDSAQKTIDLLNESIKAIQKSGDDQLEQLKLNVQAQLDKLDQQLEIQKQNLDLLKGIDSRVLSVADAMDRVAEALANLGKTPTAIGNSATNSIEDLYKDLLGRSSDASGMDFYQNLISKGYTIDDVANFIKQSDEYKNLQPAAPAVSASQSNRIIPEIDTRQLDALMARASNPQQNAVVLAEQLKLTAAAMERQQIALDRIADSTGATADVLDGASKGGRPLGITEAS